jgi:predicted RNase H-like HicB family nuclease
MKRAFTLEYWQEDEWYVSKLKEVPGVFSQGETLKELEENIEDAYKLLMEAELQTNHPEKRVIFVKNHLHLESAP